MRNFTKIFSDLGPRVLADKTILASLVCCCAIPLRNFVLALPWREKGFIFIFIFHTVKFLCNHGWPGIPYEDQDGLKTVFTEICLPLPPEC